MSKLEDILGVKFPRGTNISHATNDSRKIKKDSIFFGLPGTKKHGSNYVEEALNHGAAIAVHDDKNYELNSNKVFYIKDLNKLIIKCLNELKGIDINNNNFFTFTGTNGKTSSAFLCHQLLSNMGYESIYIGTLGVMHNNKEIQTSFSTKTTPSIFELFDIVSSANWVMDSLNICIEISSHALEQDRLLGIEYFNSASILNITNDHIDYHKSLKSYRDAKFGIFQTKSNVMLIKAELEKYSSDYSYLKKNKINLKTICDTNLFADIFFKIEKSSIKQSEFYILLNNPPKSQEHEIGKKYRFKCDLFPEFNIENLVFAICSIGFDEFSESSTNNLRYLKLPIGRVELIEGISHNVIIDYAHNEHAMDSLLSSIEKYFDNLIVVFGCGGDRDKGKRSKMLKTAIKYSSKVIFTSDNIRHEAFEEIYEDSKKDNKLDSVIAIKDRKKAIIKASDMLNKDDCLVVLGKGHEQFQEIEGEFINYSDHEVINEIYN